MFRVRADIKSVTVLDQTALDAFIEEYSREIPRSKGDMNIRNYTIRIESPAVLIQISGW